MHAQEHERRAAQSRERIRHSIQQRLRQTRSPEKSRHASDLQISLDLTNIDEALETAALAMRAGVDWLEAGTPLILAEGLHGIRALRKAFPTTPIVADLKTMTAVTWKPK